VPFHNLEFSDNDDPPFGVDISSRLPELYSKHDPVKVVSLARKTIQDAKMFEQLVDHRHLSQTPDVGFPPSDSGGSFLIIILSSSLQNGRISIGHMKFWMSGMIELELQPRVWHSQTLQSEPLGLPPSFADPCTDVQCRGSQTQYQQTDWIMLGIVGGGIGASPDVVIVAMVKGVIIGVGVSRDIIGEDVIVKIDSTPTSLIGFNMLDTNDDIDELSCGPSGLTRVRL
nr:hypothetical protein [Tanacetum cinerariifolium]